MLNSCSEVPEQFLILGFDFKPTDCGLFYTTKQSKRKGLYSKRCLQNKSDLSI